MRDLIIIGAGSMARNIVDFFELGERVKMYYDEPRVLNEDIEGIPISLSTLHDVGYCSVIGDTRQKRTLVKQLTSNYVRVFGDYPVFVNLIPDGSFIAKTVKLGEGLVIQPYTNIYSKVMIGDHVLVCGGSRIGHDTVIGRYSTVSPESAIGGGCHIGEGVFLGLNCTVLPNINIGEGSTIGAGAVIIRDVEPNSVMVGNPAKKIGDMPAW